MNDYRPGGFQVLPPVIKNLIIINVIMALLQFIVAKTFNYNLQDMLALHYWRSSEFKIWQPLTHVFMHGSPFSLQATAFHLLSNMFGLWVFGSQLERMWGSQRFLIFYLLCGIGAGLCFMGIQGITLEPLYKSAEMFKANPTLDYFQKFIFQNDIKITGLAGWENDPGNNIFRDQALSLVNDIVNRSMSTPMVGASGAVFGIIFSFGYLFPNTELMIIPLPIPIKAKWLVTGYAVIELVSGIQNSPSDPVAHFAHLGGMLVAFILLKLWLQRSRQRYY